jgi:hypothetical protein
MIKVFCDKCKKEILLSAYHELSDNIHRNGSMSWSGWTENKILCEECFSKLFM